jgi:hypothetical protein
VARGGILNANCAITLTELPAGEARTVLIVGEQDATGDRTVTVNDGSGAQTVPVPSTALAPFLIVCEWDGTDTTAYHAGDYTAADADATTKGLVQLAGDLTGTAASPQIASGAVGATEIASALKGGAAAGTEALRALGTTSTTAAAGNDARLSDTRTPTDGTVTTAKLASGVLDVDGTLAANSDTKVPSQKAVKTYVDANAGGGGGATVTKRVTVPLTGAGALGATGPGDGNTITSWGQWRLNILPFTPTRIRFKIRNASAYDGQVNTGALSFTGIYVSDPAYHTDGLYYGAASATPTQIVGAFSTASDGSEYTTAWITNPTVLAYLAAHRLHGLAWGANMASGTLVARSSVGGILQYTSDGVTDVAAQISSAAPAGLGSFQQTIGYTDVRMECEFDTADEGGMPVVLFLGDSITEGVVGGATVGSYPHQTWPGLSALQNNFAAVNLGVGGAKVSDFYAGAGWRWARADLATTVPDACVIQFGYNDISNGVDLATFKSNMATLISYVRGTLGIKAVYVGTVTPPNNPSQPTNWSSGVVLPIWASFNAWLRERPYGVVDCFNFDLALARPALDGGGDLIFDQADPALIANVPHPTIAGYSQMAREARIGR